MQKVRRGSLHRAHSMLVLSQGGVDGGRMAEPIDVLYRVRGQQGVSDLPGIGKSIATRIAGLLWKDIASGNSTLQSEDGDMHIREFQKWVKDADDETQWNCLTTLQLLAHLTEEVGELARSINRMKDFLWTRSTASFKKAKIQNPVRWLKASTSNQSLLSR